MGEAQNYTQLALEAGRVFSPTAPIDEHELFAGRIEQLRSVIDAVSQRGQHAIIFGERGVGKTSLANVLSEVLQSSGEQVVAPRVNCDGSDSFSSLWRKIFSEIELTKEVRGIGFGAQQGFVTENLAATLPNQITPDVIRRVLTALGKGAVLIVIIDEFDRLPNGNTSALFSDAVKTLSDHSVPATMVLVGVADSVDELIEQHESIERALVQIHMPRMSNGELHQIIENGLGRLSMDIDNGALRKISLLSQGLPHYTHLLGLHSAREALDAETPHVAIKHVRSAINKALEQAQQSIRNAYHKATTSPRSESLFRQVLLACALATTDDLGYFSPADVRLPMSRIMGRPYDIPSFSRHLKEFSEERRGPILQKTGTERRTRYRFVNPLMQPYVTMRGVADGLIDMPALEALRPE